MSAAEPEPPPDDHDPTRSMELVWQAQRGDAEAVNELFTRYIPRLRRFLNVRILVSQRAEVDPDDVLQETLIVATRRLPGLELRDPSSIIQWLCRIADFRIKSRLEYVRAERRNPAKERRLGLDSEDGGLRVPAPDPTPSEEFARSEMEHLIDQHLQQLEPEDYREVILQRDVCDADWETIRVLLKRPTIEAVQDLYRRAHKRLEERMSRFLD